MYVYVDYIYCVCVYTCILSVYVPRIQYLRFIFLSICIYFFLTKVFCSSRIIVSTGLGAAEQIADVYRCHLEDKTGRSPDWVFRDQLLNDIT